jgi:hypothetical protein
MRRLGLLLVLIVMVGCASEEEAALATTEAVYDRIVAAGVELGPLQALDLPGFQTQESAKAARPNGRLVYIYIPVRSWQPEAFLSLLDTGGGYVVYGDRWAVTVEDDTTASQVAQALGGTVRE